MDLSSTFMGVDIRNPVIVSSSGLTANLDDVKKLADFGAGAVVLKSLFEEQIVTDKSLLDRQDEMYYWFPEAVNFMDSFVTREGLSEYLKLIEDAKKALSIPVFASINCKSPNEWPKIASSLADSGADGLELNIFGSMADINMTGYQIEETFIDIIHEVRKNVKLPVAVKMGSHFTNLHRMLFKISSMEVNSLILFNRDFRPDIDIETLRVVSDNIFSSPQEITLALRWIALLHTKVGTELIGASGVHDASGIIKHILAGATSVQVCSTLYKNGTEYLGTLIGDLEKWMASKGYESLSAFRGLVGDNELNAATFERVQFMRKTAGKIF